MSKLTGVSQLIGNMQNVQQQATEAKKQPLFVAGQHVLGVAVPQTPIETGGLVRTGKVSQDEGTGLTAVSFDDAEYEGQAVQQHEDMSLNHDDGRNAKFLENAVNSESDVVLQIIGTGMKTEMGL